MTRLTYPVVTVPAVPGLYLGMTLISLIGCGHGVSSPVSAHRESGRLAERAPGLDAQDSRASREFERGLELLSSGSYEDAIRSFSAAAEDNPTSADIFTQRGKAFNCLGDVASAIRDYSQAIHLNWMHSEAYYLRGRALIQAGWATRGERDLTRAIDIDATFWEAYQSRGVAHYLMREYERSMEDHTEAIALRPDLVIGYTGRAVSAWGLGVKDQAVDDYTEALRMDMDFARAYLERGMVYLELGKHRAAISDFRRYAEFFPSDPDPLFLSGEAYMEMEQYDEAVAQYTRALDVDNTFVPALDGRCVAYRALGEAEKADADLARSESLEKKRLAKIIANNQELIDSDALTPEGRCAIAEGYALLDQHEEAVAQFTRAIQMDPTLARAYAGRSVSYRALGHIEKAESDTEKARSLEAPAPPADPRTHE